MADSNSGGPTGPPSTPERGMQYSLDSYRSERVETNVHRIAMERAAAGPENQVVDPSSAASPRRRAALRETSMRSGFEHVNYNLPETTAQEVVQGRQMTRDMADPGIHSDGFRVEDIVHLPPRHARLDPPAAVQRSSRDTLLAEDRAIAVGENVVPQPRPYVPRGIVDEFGAPYQHGRKVDQRDALYRQIRRQGPEIRQAGRDLQARLGTSAANPNSRSMDVREVRAAADILARSETDLNIGQRQILATLQDLQQNWYPTEVVLTTTRLFNPVRDLQRYPNAEVAQIAKELITEWRATLRADNRRRVAVPGEDPFVDEEAGENYGRLITGIDWDRKIHDRQEAARDYNNAAGEEIRTSAERRSELLRRQQAERDQQARRELRAIQIANGKALQSANTGGVDLEGAGITSGNTRNTDSIITDPTGQTTRNTDSTIIDPSLTRGQDFAIAEVDPSPERPEQTGGSGVLRQRPEDTPRLTIEVEDPVGLCHECPDFPNTYHHICSGSPACDNLLAQSRPIRQQISPNYAPSQSPQPTGQTAEECAANEAIARLQETADARRPVHSPAGVPRDMADPFTSSFTSSGVRATTRFSQQPPGKYTNRARARPQYEGSPMEGRMPQIQRETTPTVRTSQDAGRPTYAAYSAASPTQLLCELQSRQNPVASGAGMTKDCMIRALMVEDVAGNYGCGAPAPLSDEREAVDGSPIVDFSEYTSAVQEASPAARTGLRAGSKRPSPARSEGQVTKRARRSA